MALSFVIVVDIMTWWFLHKYQILKNVFLIIQN